MKIYNDDNRLEISFKLNNELIKKQVKPEWKASEITGFIESKIREDSVFKNEVNNGIGFPVGVSINDCCAHMTYSPKTRDFTVGKDDIVKIDNEIFKIIDIGVQKFNTVQSTKIVNHID